jgi:DNA-binding beta-propeller fold protein YncE
MSRLGALSLLLSLCAGGCSYDPRAFDQPTDVAFAENGDFYVADGYGNARVAKFAADGTFLLEWGEKGVGPGQFYTPHGITTDAEGRVYVADRGNARIQVFDKDGRFLTAWRSKDLGRPWGIQIGPDNQVYVVDGGDQDPEKPRGRLLRLDLSGNVQERWSSHGREGGQIDWGHDVSVGPDGSVYVVDTQGRRVQKFRKKQPPAP